MFTSPSKGELDLNKVISEISSFVSEQPDKYYQIVIGSDSQTKHVKGKYEINFVTALIVYRTGSGARYFWKKERVQRNPVLREKIYTETQMSLSAAHEIVPLLSEEISPSRYDFEIHIDVGPLGPTRDMIKEVTGMVQGNGFTAKTKPDSWGASSVADKHT
jgi:predicted RNase H-related nuclease YkuK (DUF458 family)